MKIDFSVSEFKLGKSFCCQGIIIKIITISITSFYLPVRIFQIRLRLVTSIKGIDVFKIITT